jgi:hypothetical protein
MNTKDFDTMDIEELTSIVMKDVPPQFEGLAQTYVRTLIATVKQHDELNIAILSHVVLLAVAEADVSALSAADVLLAIHNFSNHAAKLAVLAATHEADAAHGECAECAAEAQAEAPQDSRPAPAPTKTPRNVN